VASLLIDEAGCYMTPYSIAAPESDRAGGANVSARTTPPYRADHVGSLLRPPELLQAREDHKAGKIDDAALRAAEDAAIKDVVKLQEDLGLQAITDGELRRGSWHMDFVYELDGVTRTTDDMHITFTNQDGTIEFQPAALKVDGKIGLSKTIFGDAFAYLQSVVTKGTPKLTIPSPSMVHYRGGRAAVDESVYPDLDQFWSDLGDAYAEEVRRLYDMGCRYLQFDDTSLAYLNDPNQRREMAEKGADPDHQHEIYISTINRALADKPADMAITAHMCRGNHRSSWVASGSYDFVAEALFNDLHIDGYFMEWDDERSGGFEPLRLVPKGKTIVLGLVTSKRPELESKDEIKRRIEEAAQYIDIDQLCLSPQCGFASTEKGNALTVEEEAAKLRLVLEVAEEVWGR
jgi:5-methyltetrahydropteroyltriglutamate--homocysteine methyltransferase